MSTNNTVTNNGFFHGNIYQGNSSIEQDSQKKHRDTKNIYDVALSYASEQQLFVNRVKKILTEEGLYVFYAPNCEQEYKAQDMFEKFYKIFRYQSNFAVCFISKEYLQKDYTMQEYEAAYLKNKDTGQSRVIIVNFDGSEIPYLDPDINYINAQNIREIQVADQIFKIVTKNDENK